MQFNNKKFVTKGVEEKINPLLQLFMWQCIENVSTSKDYLQVFEFKEENEKKKVIHSQDEPNYMREYLLETDAPFFVGKVFVIDDKAHSTMILAEEY